MNRHTHVDEHFESLKLYSHAQFGFSSSLAINALSQKALAELKSKNCTYVCCLDLQSQSTVKTKHIIKQTEAILF